MRAPLGPLALLTLLGLFLLPFVEFSCKGQKVMTATGYEVAFGKNMTADLPISDWLKGEREPGELGKSRSRDGFDLTISQKERTQGRPLVAAALIVAVVGGLVGFLWPSLGGFAGMAACALLLVSQSDMNKEIQEQQIPLLVVNFLPGFWASFCAAAVGAVMCFLGGKK
jgi:hypothetical protein